MKIGPKYRIARRLGAEIFEKTQSQKFAMRSLRRAKESRRPRTDYGLQMLEKQKARFTYGIGERQFKRYVTEALSAKRERPDERLLQALECRIDNVMYRIGLAPTRRAARQLVSHGHMTVGGRRVAAPSRFLKPGEPVAVREGSKGIGAFAGLAERLKERELPAWLEFKAETLSGGVRTLPSLAQTPRSFDIEAILEFYKR